MEQSKLGSFIEALVNTVIGFAINYMANLLILPLFGFTSLTAKTNLILGLCYTVISVVRSYVLRRYFNMKLKSAAELVANKFNRSKHESE